MKTIKMAWSGSGKHTVPYSLTMRYNQFSGPCLLQGCRLLFMEKFLIPEILVSIQPENCYFHVRQSINNSSSNQTSPGAAAMGYNSWRTWWCQLFILTTCYNINTSTHASFWGHCLFLYTYTMYTICIKCHKHPFLKKTNFYGSSMLLR